MVEGETRVYNHHQHNIAPSIVPTTPKTSPSPTPEPLPKRTAVFPLALADADEDDVEDPLPLPDAEEVGKESETLGDATSQNA